MAEQDKVLLMNKVDGTLRTRMFANLLEEAENEIQEHLDDFDVQYVGDSTVETEDLLQAYINAKRAAGLSEKTLARYQYIIGRFLHRTGLKTRDVTTEHIRSYFSQEKLGGTQESTIDGTRSVLSGYYGWLEREKKIRINPLANIEPIRHEKKERLAFSFTDTEKMKRGFKTKRDAAIVNFLLATGCRISEMVNLNRDDVNLTDGECIVLGKGNKQRTVFLDYVAVMTLKEYLATRTDELPALFIGKRKERLQADGVRHMMKTMAKRIGVENIHPHRFRRTNVTRLLNRGMPIQEVSVLVGHAKVDTTMAYYASSKARIRNSYRMYTA